MAEMSIGEGRNLALVAKVQALEARTRIMHIADLQLSFVAAQLGNALNSGMNTSALRDAQAAAEAAKESAKALAAEINNVVNLINRATG